MGDLTGILGNIANPSQRYADLTASGTLVELAQEAPYEFTRQDLQQLLQLALEKPERVYSALQILAQKRNELWTIEDTKKLLPVAHHPGIADAIDTAIYGICLGEWRADGTEARKIRHVEGKPGEIVPFIQKGFAAAPPPMKCPGADLPSLQRTIAVRLAAEPHLLTLLGGLDRRYGESGYRVYDVDRLMARAERNDVQSWKALAYIAMSDSSWRFVPRHALRTVRLSETMPEASGLLTSLVVNRADLFDSVEGNAAAEVLFSRVSKDPTAVSHLQTLAEKGVWKPNHDQFDQLMFLSSSDREIAHLAHTVAYADLSLLSPNHLRMLLRGGRSNESLDLIAVMARDRPNLFSVPAVHLILRRIEAGKPKDHVDRFNGILVDLFKARLDLFKDDLDLLSRMARLG